MSSPNSVGIDPASAYETFLKQVVDSYYHTRSNEKEGVPLKLLPQRRSSVRLMSSPNSVGIDPAGANEDVFNASGRLALPHQAI